MDTNKQPFTSNVIKQSFDRMKHELHLDSVLVNDLLNEDYNNIGSDYDFSFKQVEQMASFLDLTIEQLLSGNFDMEALKKRFITPSIAIPTSYLKAPGTYVDTIKSVADYVERSFSIESKKHLLQSIEMTDATLNTQGLLLNVNALNATGKALESLNLSKADLNQLAMFVNFKAKRNIMSQLIKDCKYDSEVASVLCDVTGKIYDKNFSYSLKEMDDRFQINAVSKEEIHDELKLTEICGDVFNYFKAFSISNTTVQLFGKKMLLLDVSSELKDGRQVQKYTFKNSRLQ